MTANQATEFLAHQIPNCPICLRPLTPVESKEFHGYLWRCLICVTHDERIKWTTPPFDWVHHHQGCFTVDRWKGKHTDGPDCDFYRVQIDSGDMMAPKPGVEIDRSSLLRESIPFGKYKGTEWKDVPMWYLVGCYNRLTGKKWLKMHRVIGDVLEIRKNEWRPS